MYSTQEIVLNVIWDNVDEDSDDKLNTVEMGKFIKKYMYDVAELKRKEKMIKGGQSLEEIIRAQVNDQALCDEFEKLLKKFRQDPQDMLDFIRKQFNVPEGKPIPKDKFMKFPELFIPILEHVSLQDEEDDDPGTLSRSEMKTMENRQAELGARKSRSASKQPDQMPSVHSHRGKTKKKRRRKGQKYFPEEELMGKYEFVKYLGHGSYGHVCEARAQDGSKVALKKVDKIFGNIIDAKRFLREIVCLRVLKNHEAIVDLIDILPPHGRDISKFNALYLVFEYVDTDLHHLIGTNQFFSELHCQYMLYQTLLSLKFMHTGQLVHRDLKPANILINEDCSVKLCDFGLARGFQENLEAPHPKTHLLQNNELDLQNERKMKLNRDLTRHIVTRWYRAPEVILITQNRKYLPAIDMWSIGCIMSELLQMQKSNVPDAGNREPLFPGKSCFPLSAKDPFAYQDRMDQLNVIFDVIGTPPKNIIMECCNEQCQRYLLSLPKKKKMDLKKRFPGTNDLGIDLLTKLLEFDYRKRITSEEALQHPYFSDVRDPEAEVRHEPMKFKFEDVGLSMKTIRELIVDEVFLYNEDTMERRASTYTRDKE